jgi:hypothetical protein
MELAVEYAEKSTCEMYMCSKKILKQILEKLWAELNFFSARFSDESSGSIKQRIFRQAK